MEATDDEKKLGIEVFFTDVPGIGGKLRSKPEDFRVFEVPREVRLTDVGKYVILEVTSKNWETNHLVREVSKRLKISRKRIKFAGTKDRRAVTTQLFSIYYPEEELPEIKLKDVEIRYMGRSDKGLEIGDLIGNRFHITIREIENGEAAERIEKIHQQLKSIGGFPNFYGFQRFGSLRPVTHLVGKEIVKGDFDRAVDVYLTYTTEKEEERYRTARERFAAERDITKALSYFPKQLTFELTLLNELKRGKNSIEALQALPKNLLMMFLYAYQSYLFNRILSERIRRGLPLGGAIEGDLIVPLTKYGEEDEIIPVTHRNIDKVNKMISLRKAAVTGAIVGYNTKFADGEMGEIERKVVEEEKIDIRDFIVPEIPFLSSHGGRRVLVSEYRDFVYRFPDNSSVEMSFFLRKGTYATSLLREFMKCKDIRNY